ncbi:MAG TPA: endonuclease MutS2 [bacterium]|nr:endonuclease MutS2 [bacterium]
MTPRALRVLGFPAVLERLAGRCVSTVGRERALALTPSPWVEEVERRQQETSEARALLEQAGGLPVRGARDIRASTHRAQIGGVLTPRELLDIRDTLGVARTLKGFLASREADVPVLAEIADGIEVFSELEGEIAGALNDEGIVVDGASPDLARIRRERRASEARLRERMEQVLRTPAMARMLQDPLITIRDDRFVVPVRAEFREQFPGVAHDQSASGMTVFMEPLAAVPLGNRLRELAAEEREEVARILAALSAAVGAAGDRIVETLMALGELDVAAAKAHVGAEMGAAAPRLNAAGCVDLREARHPLLTGTVVPIDIRLGDAFRTLVITGPNTGGKTVTLRTLGLLTLMAEAGLHVPAAPESDVAVFPHVYADIGDEQSVEQNLSTFSSHLTAIVEILEALRGTPPGPARALVLLDEVGAGTDPAEGAALARALIETLHAVGACTAVTTHYNELKSLAFTHPGVENASVEFDDATLRPTYRLLIGTPGRSNALAIANRLGLASEIIERAKGYLSPHATDLTRVIQRVEEERDALFRERETLVRERADLARAEARAREEAQRLAADRRRVLERFQAELAGLQRRAEGELQVLLAALRSKPTPEATAQVRAHLRELRQLSERYAVETRVPVSGAPPQDLRVGDTVLVTSLGQRGVVQVLPDARGEVEVQVGALKVRVSSDELRRVDDGRAEREAPNAADAAREGPGQGPLAKALSVPASIHLRGKRTEEALAELDKYLDDAVLAGLPRATIIHGKGTGTLRRAVHEYLAHHPEVVSFRVGADGEGGTGATIVEFAEQ